jgi:phospholipid-binding lipoprotein MlaA
MNRVLSLFILAIFFSSQNSFAQDLLQNKESTLINNNLEDEDFESYNTVNSTEIYDPYENVNRKIYVFNDAFDRYFFEYVAKIYRKGVPRPARKMVGNFISNLSLPMSAFNSLLQGKVDNGLATFSNFLINSTIGVFGLFEIASEKGIFFHYEDFGQTMGHYEMGSGAYLIIPLLGPSSTRDFSGWAFERSISPSGFNAFEIGGKENFVDPGYLIGLTVLSAVSTRESLIETLDDIRKDSFDPYATIRSAYLQKRINEVNK